MIRKHLAPSLATLSLALIVATSCFSTAAQAQFRPPNRGTPGTTAGGATRGSSFCVTGKTPLTVLVPSSQLGLTTVPRPTFFAYVPPTSAKSAEFVLQDKQGNDVYRTTVEIAGKSGIVDLRLPETAPALEVGKDYRWYFSIVCRPGDRLQDVFVSAWVQRIQPSRSVADALSKAPLREHPAIYAQASVWYDTLATLADLRRNSPNDATLKKEWVELLNFVGLSKISQEPLAKRPSLRMVHSR